MATSKSIPTRKLRNADVRTLEKVVNRALALLPKSGGGEDGAVTTITSTNNFYIRNEDGLLTIESKSPDRPIAALCVLVAERSFGLVSMNKSADLAEAEIDVEFERMQKEKAGKLRRKEPK
jgi:hypothetical protein